MKYCPFLVAFTQRTVNLNSRKDKKKPGWRVCRVYDIEWAILNSNAVENWFGLVFRVNNPTCFNSFDHSVSAFSLVISVSIVLVFEEV